MRKNKITRTRLTRALLLFSAAIMALPAAVQAIGPYTVSGTVYKLESPATGLADVTVKAYKGMTDDEAGSTTTDPSGAYSLSVSVEEGDQDRFIAWTKDGRVTTTTHFQPLGGPETANVWMSEHYSDPPSLGDYLHYNAEEEIYFKQGGTYYRGAEERSMGRIFYDNSNFEPYHGSSQYWKAKNGNPEEKLANRVTHVHHRHNYGSGPSTPGWGASPTWPTAAEGKAYWDWMYSAFDASGGTTPNMDRNCVSYAFDERNSLQTQVDCWVNPQDYGGSPQMNKLWNALSTTVYPDGEHTFVNCPISDKDVAGTDKHVWLLFNSGGATAAKTAKWTNAGSGEYVWGHGGSCGANTNKAPKAGRVESMLVSGKLWEVTDKSNPYYTDGKIKRE